MTIIIKITISQNILYFSLIWQQNHLSVSNNKMLLLDTCCWTVE